MLKTAINDSQSSLPANGVIPVIRQRTDRFRDLYQEYNRQRTVENWKFWAYATLFEPMMESFNQNVSNANVDELCRSVRMWIEQHCTLLGIRRSTTDRLIHIARTTDLLAQRPTTVRQEVERAIQSQPPPSSSSAPGPSRSRHSRDNDNNSRCPQPPSDDSD